MIAAEAGEIEAAEENTEEFRGASAKTQLRRVLCQ
jgi:hypothetical protein